MTRPRPERLQQLALTALVAAMVLAFSASLDDFWHMNDALWQLALLAAATAGCGWLHWRYPGAMRWSLAAGLPTVVLVALYFQESRKVLAGFLQLLQNFVVRLLQDPFTTMEPVLAYFFLALIALLVAVLMAWEALQRGDGFWSLVLGTVVFGQQWLMYYDNTTWYMIFCTFGILLWAVARSARRDSAWQAEGRRVITHSALGAAVGLCTAIALFSLVAPSGFEPVDLGAYASKLQQRFPALQRLRGAGVGTGDENALTGFSSALSNLGGPVTPSLSPVLQVETDKTPTDTLYLRGDARSIYEGKLWNRPEATPAAVDPATGIAQVYGADVPTTAIEAKITVEQAGSFVVFSALDTRRIEGFSEPLLQYPWGTLTARRSLAKGAEYTLALSLPQVTQPPLRGTGFADFAALQQQPEFAPYFALPDNLPQRVRDLAAQVTRDAATPFDAAVALEYYLRTEFPYTLEAPKTPANRDFVDFFLFEGKKGYCTYYSSALAVMLRSIGVPARWVTGFAIAPPLLDEVLQVQDTVRNFTVRDADAHAWVEVYFPSTGWVTFDPTPRYATPYRAATLPGASVEPLPAETTPALPPAPAPTPTLADRLGRLGWGVRLALGLAALAALALAGAAWRLRQLAALPLGDGPLAVQAVWPKLELLMTQMGTERRPAETVREYAGRLGREWPQLQPALEGMPERYAAARYSAPAAAPKLGADAVGRVRELWRAAEQAARDRYGAPGFYWRRLRPRWRLPWRRRSEPT